MCGSESIIHHIRTPPLEIDAILINNVSTMIYHDPAKESFHPAKHWGKIHVYTGDGKGKTTAALGLSLRALGHGFSVLMIQFFKNHKEFGELKIGSLLHPRLEIVQFGQQGLIDLAHPSAIDIYYVREGVNYARKALRREPEKRPHLLVLDEINVALAYNMIPLDEVLDFLDNKHQNTEIVLTGRYAPDALIKRADLVTEMNAIKHYYTDDFTARKGIEH